MSQDDPLLETWHSTGNRLFGRVPYARPRIRAEMSGANHRSWANPLLSFRRTPNFEVRAEEPLPAANRLQHAPSMDGRFEPFDALLRQDRWHRPHSGAHIERFLHPHSVPLRQ